MQGGVRGAGLGSKARCTKRKNRRATRYIRLYTRTQKSTNQTSTSSRVSDASMAPVQRGVRLRLETQSRCQYSEQSSTRRGPEQKNHDTGKDLNPIPLALYSELWSLSTRSTALSLPSLGTLVCCPPRHHPHVIRISLRASPCHRPHQTQHAGSRSPSCRMRAACNKRLLPTSAPRRTDDTKTERERRST